MYEEVWGGYRPQQGGYDVIFTPQMTLTYQIWGQLGPCNSIRVQPYALETAYQCFKHIIYVCVCVTETPVGVGRLQSRDINRIARAAPTWSFSY
jgi:hypothetical protein